MSVSIAQQSPTDIVLDALRAAGSRVMWANGQNIAQCPAHGDRMPSLTIKAAEDGKALVYCHAGCDTRDILDAIGLRQSDLFPDSGREEPVNAPWAAYLAALREIDAPKLPSGDAARTLPENLKRDKVAHYDYVGPNGENVARVVRYQLIDKDTGEFVGKTFTQQRWDGHGYVNGLDGMDMPLYRLPAVLAAVAAGLPVFVVEGEKDADTAAGIGMIATTCPMGAGSWKQQHTDALAGANVGIVVDQDGAGRAHADSVKAALEDAGCHVTLLAPKQGKDLTDHVEAGFGMADLQLVVEVEGTTQEEEEEALSSYVLENFPILDWHALWADDTPQEWIIEPILPARRLVSIYSPPKVGKSLLLLEMAAAVATGRPMFGFPDAPDPRVVLYVDFENDPQSDVKTRLQAMGYGPDDLGNLRYLSFPTMSHLDGEQGSQELMANVHHHGATVVVIDTVSRAIRGEENENDTWLAFYRHTGLKLKQAGISLIRLDHTGKDVTKGQRGGSAKSGDVDAVWRLARVNESTYYLECEAKRFQIAQTEMTLTRERTPWLRHVLDPLAITDGFKKAVAAALVDLDAHAIDASIGGRKAREVLKAFGKSHSERAVKEAQAKRRIGHADRLGESE